MAAGKQVKLNPTFSEGVNLAPMHVPERLVQRYLDKGWVIAEGETFKPPKEKVKGGRVLEINESLVPGGENNYTKPLRADTVDSRSYDENEADGEDDDENGGEQGTGVDTGTALGANDVVREPIIQDDRRKVTPSHPATAPKLVGLDGVDIDTLRGIALAEGVEVEANAAKPIVKAAILAKRNADPVVADDEK